MTKKIYSEDSCLLGYEIVHIVTNFSEESSSGLLLLGRLCTAVLGFVQGDPREPDIFKINSAELFFK